MLVMTYRCGIEETVSETRNTCTHWKVRGVNWNDYKKDQEITEWNMMGGVDEANDRLCERINEVAENRIGKTKQGKKGKLCNR